MILGLILIVAGVLVSVGFGILFKEEIPDPRVRLLMGLALSSLLSAPGGAIFGAELARAML